MVFNFRKIASVATSALMVTSTAAMALAANFPAPFTSGSSSNVAIVYGAAAPGGTDLVAATDIASSLSSSLASDGGTTIDDTFSGDKVQLQRSSDKFNMGEDIAGFGATIDDDDLSTILKDGTYTTSEGETHDYTQKLTLYGTAGTTLKHFADSDYDDKRPHIGLHIPANTAVVNYTLDFITNPESDLVSGDLDDLESTKIEMMGKEYFIFDVDNSTLDLTLLDAASSAILNEGESVTVQTNEGSYDVSIAFIGTSEVKLTINGETTDSIQEKQTRKLQDGSYVGIKDISVQDYAGGVKQVEFSIGSGKLFLDNGGTVELNDDDVDGVKVYTTRGTPNSGKEEIDKIVLEWITDDEMFLTSSSDLIFPGFETFKFSMNELIKPYEEVVKVQPDGTDSIELVVPIEDGDAKFNILYADSDGNFTGIGGSSTEKLVTTSGPSLNFSTTDDDEWFVVSWNTTTDSESYLLKISGSDIEEDADGNKTTIRNAVTGKVVCSKKKAADECDIGSATITINEVYKAGSNRWVNISGGSGVSFNKMYTKEGLAINLPYTSGVTNTSYSSGGINLTASDNGIAGHNNDTFHLIFEEEDKDGNLNDAPTAGNPTLFNITIDDNSDNELETTKLDGSGTGGPNGLETDDGTKVYETYLNTSLATKITHTVVSNGQDSMEIVYHGDEVYAEMFISEGATVSGSSGVNIVPILDSEVDTASGKNLIVVGGSCINTVAADLLGLSASTCGADWEAATTVGAGEFLIQTFDRGDGTVATLVAGYNAGDTTNAGKYLTTNDVDTTAGKKYIGTSATSADIVTI